jgi:enamine deaminase RidA (YjgF/YER057c/UK114 family)
MGDAKITMINPAAFSKPSGYNNGILVEGGKLLFVAGQVGWDLEKRIVSDHFTDQFAQALENVLAVVREAGGAPESIVRLQIFVIDKREYLSELRAIGAVYRQLMGRHFPAMTLVEVAGLVEESARVEIEAIAAV